MSPARRIDPGRPRALKHIEPYALPPEVRVPNIRERAEMKSILAGLAMAVSSFAYGAAAHAEVPEQRFKITQVFAQTHWHWTEGMKVFADEVEKASGGKITFEPYHAGQLGKESTMLVTSGLSEMGLLVPSYETDKLPLTSVTELPGLHENACKGTRKYWNVAKEGGALYEAEYKRLGVRPLYVILLPPYQLMTNTKPVDSIADVAGLKIRANGAAMDKTIRALGAIPVKVTTNELYDALSRGTIDGSFWIIGTTKLVGLEKLLRHTVQGPQLGAGSTFFAISEKVWERLDPETQQIFAKAGEKTMDHLCKYLDDTDVQVTKELIDEGLLTVHALSPEENKVWADRIQNVADDWAKEMDSTGRPGTALLEAYRAAPAQ